MNEIELTGLRALTSVPGGRPWPRRRSASRRAKAAAASNVKPVSISWEIATEGMPMSVPSKAADTVPE